MKIKLYIVTYVNYKDLTCNLQSLFNTNWSGNHLEVNIINNHSNFQIDDMYKNKVNIIHNSVRPDFSTGHLSRNWNQAIINGFKNILNPDCDILIHCQDDTIFHTDWCKNLISLHEKYSFVQMGIGDNLCSYTPEAILNIGLWDERFCGIGFQEADYFLRARIHNKDKSSINDHFHGRIHNQNNLPICNRTSPNVIDGKLNVSKYHKKSMKYHHLNLSFFHKKWGKNILPEKWNDSIDAVTNSFIDNYIYYPYFELDIPGLKEKNYFIEGKDTVFMDNTCFINQDE